MIIVRDALMPASGSSSRRRLTDCRQRQTDLQPPFPATGKIRNRPIEPRHEVHQRCRSQDLLIETGTSRICLNG